MSNDRNTVEKVNGFVNSLFSIRFAHSFGLIIQIRCQRYIAKQQQQQEQQNAIVLSILAVKIEVMSAKLVWFRWVRNNWHNFLSSRFDRVQFALRIGWLVSWQCDVMWLTFTIIPVHPIIIESESFCPNRLFIPLSMYSVANTHHIQCNHFMCARHIHSQFIWDWIAYGTHLIYGIYCLFIINV